MISGPPRLSRCGCSRSRSLSRRSMLRVICPEMGHSGRRPAMMRLHTARHERLAPRARADRRTRGKPTTISHRATMLAVCAVAGAVGLAACSKEQLQRIGFQLLWRVRLGAGGQRHGARRHDHLGRVARNSSPTWIFPMIPSANDTTAPSTTFVWEMWRPLYWYTNGVNPTETPSMSLANQPTYSNGDKTVTVTLKTNYKWSDGQPADLKGRAVLPRRGAGRREGERGQLGQLHPARRDTRPGGQRQHAERHHDRDQPEQAGQPDVVHRGPTRGDSADAGPRLGQGLGERPDRWTSPTRPTRRRSTTTWPRRPARRQRTRPTRCGRS